MIAPPDDARADRAADTRLRSAVPRRRGARRSCDRRARRRSGGAGARRVRPREDSTSPRCCTARSTARTILYGAQRRPRADYLAALAEQTLRAGAHRRRSRSAPRPIAGHARRARRTAGATQSAFFAVFGIFFLTLFLSGQVVGTMAEERNNKVIEVLAAAVPLESVFLGKLLGMFGVAVLFVGFWGDDRQPDRRAAARRRSRAGSPSSAPRSGCRPFALLFAAYFTMAYLLLGSVFLGVGAQASTMREIQMLSLPITIMQVAMFALSSAAASQPGQLGGDRRRGVPAVLALRDGGARRRTRPSCGRTSPRSPGRRCGWRSSSPSARGCSGAGCCSRAARRAVAEAVRRPTQPSQPIDRPVS